MQEQKPSSPVVQYLAIVHSPAQSSENHACVLMNLLFVVQKLQLTIYFLLLAVKSIGHAMGIN